MPRVRLSVVDTLVLVRHGATAWNDNGYFQGLKDVPLSPRGREQVAALGRRMRDEGVLFDRVFSSPLTRAIETARAAGGEPEIEADLIELDRGHWEGHPGEEIRRRWGRLWKAWYDDPAGLAMPGGESFDAVWERAGRILARIGGEPGACALICAHKAFNRVFLARATGLPTKGVWDLAQPQACRSVLVRAGAGWTAERIGDVDHLPPELRSSS